MTLALSLIHTARRALGHHLVSPRAVARVNLADSPQHPIKRKSLRLPTRRSKSYIRAGRLMIERLRQLADAGEDFAFETNLSSRSLAPFIRRLQGKGYRVRLYFFSLPSSAHAKARVALRVVQGGHHVADDVVERRFESGRRLFRELYCPLVDEWRVLDGSVYPAEIIAVGGRGQATVVDTREKWKAFEKS